MIYKMVILVNMSLKMKPGKIAAQVAHAVLECYKKAVKTEKMTVKLWELSGQEKVVLKVKDRKELLKFKESVKNKFPVALIRDAGHTQIPSGSMTCLAIGPAVEKDLDSLTGELKLL